MRIDTATRRNLELTKSINTGTKHGSLLGTIDRTVTAAGGRLLERRISSPSMDISLIENRHKSLEFFHKNIDLSDDLMGFLKSVPDLELSLIHI